ncbi:PA0069 family radical SAM protein [Caulobacter sp. RHG1]|uniref:PA0069 family radical SAM protein n=1 Tax=Caulobacter sp. (strain RHG1) TaxID=2545762 RepID=UPI001551B0F3|nr:PA0069 family radical SAM protein [Caulobacter sp. RHG1]
MAEAAKLGPVPRGRGAKSNRTGRFESQVNEAFDDGWGEDEEPKQLKTELQPMKSRTIIARNQSPDIGFDRSINPYRGCSHGCIYCYARPAHAYLGLSPGLDFESKIFFKPHAGELLTRELSKPAYKPATIHIGGDTDPYQPDEKQLRVTRQVIEVLERCGHPFTIITKSALILRDLDIYARLAARGLTRVAISITTLDRHLARSMEPRAATPGKRIEAVRRLTEAGVPVTVMFAPAIPGLNDHEVEGVLEAAAKAGARGAGYVALRLPREIAQLFEEWLQTDHPDRARRVMSLVRQIRHGENYNASFGERMTGDGPVAEVLRQRFQLAVKKFGLDQPWTALDASQFVPPRTPSQQMDLFG